MLQDARTRSVVIQLCLVGIVLALAWLVASSTAANLRARGIPLGFDFLWMPAGFQISETIIPYKPRDPYWYAALVGVVNTLFISIIVIVVSSFSGLIVGVGRLSSNPLVNSMCRTWVEIARNTPVIVLLIFLYSVWWKVLPQVQNAWEVAPGSYLSLRGLAVPSISIGLPLAAWLLAPLLIAALFLTAYSARRRQDASGRRPLYTLALMAFLAALASVAAAAGLVQFEVEWPRFERANFFGGWQLTPELTTILLGLSIYTTGFIAEIIRGGILAIGKGQWEAGRAVGLSEWRILRLVIIPQTLRVIVPPLNSQYINVVKNSTLAIAVGYQDFMTIMGTVINRSSHAIEGIAIILGVFLVLNLSLSALLNWYNQRIMIVER